MGHSLFFFSNGTCQSYRKGYHGIENTHEEMDVWFLYELYLWNALRHFVPFVLFEKREKYP